MKTIFLLAILAILPACASSTVQPRASQAETPSQGLQVKTLKAAGFPDFNLPEQAAQQATILLNQCSFNRNARINPAEGELLFAVQNKQEVLQEYGSYALNYVEPDKRTLNASTQNFIAYIEGLWVEHHLPAELLQEALRIVHKNEARTQQKATGKEDDWQQLSYTLRKKNFNRLSESFKTQVKKQQLDHDKLFTLTISPRKKELQLGGGDFMFLITPTPEGSWKIVTLYELAR